MSTNQASKTDHRVLATDSGRWLALALGVAITVVALDLLTKWVIEREIGPTSSRSHIDLIGNTIQLRFALNSGVAFGLLHGRSTIAGIMVGIIIIPLVIVLILMASRGPIWALAAGLVLGGAAGNLIDRIGDQTVTDFISIWRWPSFNVADASITVGALLLIALSLVEHHATPIGDEAPTQ